MMEIFYKKLNVYFNMYPCSNVENEWTYPILSFDLDDVSKTLEFGCKIWLYVQFGNCDIKLTQLI